MSGGSYGYLELADGLLGLIERRVHLEDVFNRLNSMDETEFPGAAKAAEKTGALLTIISQYDQTIDVLTDDLKEVWHAVEWEDSNDGFAGQIQEALTEYTKER